MEIEEVLRANTNLSLDKTDSKYIVSINNDGIPCIDTAKIKIIGQSAIGITRPKITLVNDKVKAFLKDSSKVDASDDLEMVTNYLGNIFGLPMAKEYRVFDESFKKNALLSISVTQRENERFVEFFDVMMTASAKVKNNEFPMQAWMNDWLRINSQIAFPELEDSYEFYCKYDSDIDIAIRLPIYALEICHPDKKEEIEKFAKCYFSMLVFDIFIGQTDRNMNNYGVIYTENSYSFAPLFDNSTLAKPYLPENLYSLNKVLIDREKILRILVENYSVYVVDLIRKIAKIYEEKKELIFEMIDMWIDNHNKALIKKNIESAYLLFKEI